MAINIRKYIDITSGIAGRNKADRRDLMGLVMTDYDENGIWNTPGEDQIYGIREFATADEVLEAFGGNLKTPEYMFAVKYFGFLSKSITKAKFIKFAHWQKSLPTNTPTFPFGFGIGKDKVVGKTFQEIGTTRAYSLDLFRANGGKVTFTLTIAGKAFTFALDFNDILDNKGGAYPTDQDKYHAMGTLLNGELRFLLAGGANINQFKAIDKTNYRARFQEEFGRAPTAEEEATWVASLQGKELFQFVVGRSTIVYDETTGLPVEGKTISEYDREGKYRPMMRIGAAEFIVPSDWDGAAQPEPTPCDGLDITFGAGFEYFGLGTDNGTTVYKADSAVEAISKVVSQDDNFGSFTFICRNADGNVMDLGFEEIVQVAQWNHTNNYKFLYSVSGDRTMLHDSGLAYMLSSYSGTVLTERPADTVYKTYDSNKNIKSEEERIGINYFSAYIPMVLFATTNYSRENSTRNFMYQFFEDTTLRESQVSEWWCKDPATVSNWNLARRLDDSNINYIGETQQAGKIIRFYQDGYNTDGLDTACYCNEVWLKDAILCELLNAFITLERVPANDVGCSILKNRVLTVLDEAIANGTVMVNKELTTSQKEYIDRMTGVEGAWGNVVSSGYYLDISLRGKDGDKSTAYMADYVLLYAKGDSIRKVEGSNILF